MVRIISLRRNNPILNYSVLNYSDKFSNLKQSKANAPGQHGGIFGAKGALNWSIEKEFGFGRKLIVAEAVNQRDV